MQESLFIIWLLFCPFLTPSLVFNLPYVLPTDFPEWTNCTNITDNQRIIFILKQAFSKAMTHLSPCPSANSMNIAKHWLCFSGEFWVCIYIYVYMAIYLYYSLQACLKVQCGDFWRWSVRWKRLGLGSPTTVPSWKYWTFRELISLWLLSSFLGLNSLTTQFIYSFTCM